MSVDEQKTMNKAENHARSAIISLGMSVQTTVSHELRTRHRGINNIPQCFSCPGDCKELSNKTRRNTHDSKHTRLEPS